LWHPFGWVIPFNPPLEPVYVGYQALSGGFMNLHSRDIVSILMYMAQAIASNPIPRLGSTSQIARNLLGQPAEHGGIGELTRALNEKAASMRKSIETSSSWEPFFPARVEILREVGDTLSPHRVVRKTSKLPQFPITMGPPKPTARLLAKRCLRGGPKAHWAKLLAKAPEGDLQLTLAKLIGYDFPLNLLDCTLWPGNFQLKNSMIMYVGTGGFSPQSANTISVLEASMTSKGTKNQTPNLGEENKYDMIAFARL
jgi:hypothetical protein